MKLSKFLDYKPIIVRGNIGSRTFDVVMTRIMENNWERPDKTRMIPILIHSYGGDAETMIQVMSLLKEQKQRGVEVLTFASGPCMSAAFYIYMMGDVRYADRNVNLMHHKIRTSLFSGTDNDAEFEKQEMQRLDKVVKRMIQLKLNKEEASRYDAGLDVYWRYKEAKEKGIIT